MLKRIHLLTLLMVSVPWSVAALAATMTGLSVDVNEDGSEQVAITANERLSPTNGFMLPHPDRVVIDLPLSDGALKLPASYNGRLIKGVRFGRFNESTSRLVLDLAMPATLEGFAPGNPLIIDLAPESPLAPVVVKPPVDNRGAGKSLIKNPPVNKKGKVIVSSAAEKKLALEPEDRKPLIAIDAGHGGQDPGAIGAHETHERDVTLGFALALRKALLRTGRYRVILTREDDRFILLHERVNIARKAHADMMVSLHADSNPRPEAKGLSIYTLSATASDAEAAALAEHENKADVISGIDLSTTDQDVANILIDLTQRETMSKSTTLADIIVSKLHPKITRLPGTHRFAGFRVLKAPDIPSVLIELGFISNVTDEKLLLSPEYRDLVVESIIKGIDRYYAGN